MFRQYRSGRLTGRIFQLPFAKVDLHRSLRRRFPEVIFAQGKSAAQVVAIAQALRKNDQQVLVTKVSDSMAQLVLRQLPWLQYLPQAGFLAGPTQRAKRFRRASHRAGQILVVTAGTGDIPIAEEAAVTAELMGQRVRRLFDVGVAGLHRLLKNLREIQRARVIVVVAGMDGALPSVISGLTASPIVAVPTSVGYGASFRGVAPLLTMLNSCSPGVAVVNIDNGFGAGYLAVLIARGGRSRGKG